MTAELTLIGRLAAGLMQTVLDNGAGDPGNSRFLIRAMENDEILAIVDAIEADVTLAPRIEICLPRYRFVEVDGVKAEHLTDVAAAELRHADCAREGRFMVLNESEKQSLAQVEAFDAEAMLDEGRAGRWIDIASEGLVLPEESIVEWEAALVALLRIHRAGLRQVAEFVSATAAALGTGETVPRALGRSLLTLGIPRFDNLFDDIAPAKRRQPSQWRSRFESHWRRDCYIAKRDRTQTPLPGRARLREKLEELRERMREEVQSAIEAYIDAPDGTSDVSRTLFHIDWSELQQFFEEAQKSEGRSLGQETYDFYRINDPELLTDAERDYLKLFAEQRRQNPTKTPDDETFYASHANELREEKRLAALWERFIFGQRVECRDLLDGIVQSVQRLYQPNTAGAQKLIIEGQERSPSNFLPLNDEVCCFFATRYRGLENAFPGLVEFKNVKAFDYLGFRDDIKKYAKRKPDSSARAARQLHFRVWLEAGEGASVEKSAELRLVWEANPRSIGMGLTGDLERLLANNAKTPMVRCRANRAGIGRSQGSGVDLHDRATFEPDGARERGAFAPPKSRAESIPKLWAKSLQSLLDDELTVSSITEPLDTLFGMFETLYAKAITALLDEGLGAKALTDQAAAFGKLLGAIVETVEAPVAIDRLLQPLLEIGVAQLEGPGASRPIAIVTPWHPLRLAGQAARWSILRAHLTSLLSAGGCSFTDSGRLYFGELRRALGQSIRPDVVTGWNSAKPIILAQTDALNDYSVHEPATAEPGEPAMTNDHVVPIARQITELVKHYLDLQPHERDNLSVVLYNCDAAALPQAVVDSLRAEAERNGGDAMCQVILRHRDEDRLRQLYQQLVSRDIGDDSLHASEATRDFMSRLRISIMVNTTIPPMGADGPPLDIVFCHDVISRAAAMVWVDVGRTTYAATEIDPGQWSRRRPIRRGDRDAVVYLTCPAQPAEGWDYLDALAALHNPGAARKSRQAGETLVPARQTTVQDPATQQILEETHRLASWVVNFDDLLDRRQLLDNQIRIIRYKHAGPDGRSLIISSQAPDALLRATLRSRIRALDPSYSEEELAALSSRLIDDANAVSGDLVLRAAKHGSNANELLGVVLSKYMVDAELAPEAPRAWVFLDDYASWLGQDEKHIADLLCLAPGTDKDGNPVLDVVVTEAKYVAAASANAKAGISERQLRDTLQRLEEALLADVPPADAAIWRARLSDILLDRLRDPSGNILSSAADWRVTLRAAACAIRLRGYSHVFAHGAPGVGEQVSNDRIGVKQTGTGFQERYGPETLRRFLRAYADQKSPNDIRREAIGDWMPDTPVATAASPAPDGTTAPSAPLETVSLSEPAPTDELERGRDGIASENEVPVTRLDAVIAELASEHARGDSDVAWLEEAATRCRNALLRYGMSARLESKILTPNAALLKFKGSDELTVSSVERRLTELQTTHALEVLSVRAEPGFVVISILRPHRETLSIGEVWQNWERPTGEANNRLLIAVKEEDGSPLYLEPEPAPHSLVAGSTGSGKSVLVQNILLGIAATNRPDQAEIVLIDPKSGVDYFAFEPLPHLTDGIIDDVDDALAKLETLVQEMERRYTLFKAARVSNIRSYNQKSDKPLPTVWLVHDEFADWMQIDEYRSGVEAAVSRLGVKARAAGIYLIFAAQRPDASVFPMQLRANLGNRLVLRVDSAGTSDLSLGVKNGSAERLLGKGHLAAILGGGTDPIYAQVPFIREDELPRLVDAIIADLE